MSELNFATTIEAVGAAVPDRPAVVHGARRIDYRTLLDRSRRLARYLHDHGLGCFAPRASLAGHQSGQHFLAQYLYNSPEYLEGMLGGYLARVAPFNVNYRYVAEELCHLLTDGQPRAVQYHARFAPVLAAALAGLSVERPVLLQVADDSGEPLLPGAVDYESALGSVPARVPVEPSPDDIYALYTGGTTGMPKCVLWRQADVAVTGVGLVNRRAGREWDSVAEVVGAIGPRAGRMLPCAPLMHGAAQWGALLALCTGNTVVFPDQVHRFDPAGVWDAVARERVELLGRDSVTINSGGEKVYEEEVEAAVKRHPDVADAVVCGRPSARWGAEVVAIVAPRFGVTLTADALLATCATTLARYKLPKEIIFVDRVQRSPSGKADYRWAAARALLGG